MLVIFFLGGGDDSYSLPFEQALMLTFFAPCICTGLGMFVGLNMNPIFLEILVLPTLLFLILRKLFVFVIVNSVFP